MINYWHCFPSAFPKEKCEELKEIYKAEKTVQGVVGPKQEVIKEIRLSKVLPVAFGSQYNFLLTSLLHQYITIANRESFGVHLNNYSEHQIARYNEGDFYAYHVDDFTTTNIKSNRKLSVTLQLSDTEDYEGGDFQFMKYINPPEKVQIRKVGTVLIFPSFLQHRVTKVTKGSRYSVVGWYEGNDWK